MTKIVLIQGSLNKNSKTAIVLNEVNRLLREERKIQTEIIDLRDIELEWCDGRPSAQYNDDLQRCRKIMNEADGFIIGMPVYSYSVSGPLKNFLDIVIGAMDSKVAGVVCQSGGIRSFLASADLMKILSFEADVISVQPVVHTYVDDFVEGKLANPGTSEVINQMIDGVLRYLPAHPDVKELTIVK